MFQYGYTQKPSIGSFVVNTTPTTSTPPNGYTETHLSAIVTDSVSKNLVPASSSTKKNIAYFILPYPSITFSAGHFLSTHYATAGDSTNSWYKIIGSASLNDNFDNYTKLISSTCLNIVAMQVTSGGGKGYTMKQTTGSTTVDAMITKNGQELGSVCFDDVTNNKIAGSSTTVGKYWSDQDGACVLPSSTTNPTPWASCHTGAVFDTSIQACKLQTTGGTGGGTTPTGGTGLGYKIVKATASDDDGNVPANAIDGKLDTRWSAFGKGQDITLFLDTAKPIDKIKIAWYQGDKRSNSFEIKVATADASGPYTSVKTGNSTKGSAALQDYAITPAVSAKYVRIYVNGNTLNDWASISEVEIWGPGVPTPTPGTGTGGDPGSGGVTPGGDTGGGTTTPPPPTEAGYNFFDTSFSIDYKKIGLCNPAE
jgi:hypothetical protein